jgi:hypothetical protein
MLEDMNVRGHQAWHKLIGKLTKSFAPKMCTNYFRYAGYTR